MHALKQHETTQPLDLSDPMMIARMFREAYDVEGLPSIYQYRDDIYFYGAPCFRAYSESRLISILYQWLERQNAQTKEGIKCCKPTRALVKEVAEALRAIAYFDETRHLPAWIEPNGMPTDFIICKNGILDLITKALRPPTPGLFSTSSVQAEYLPSADCPIWLRFLEQLFDNDLQTMDALQEFIGYSLTLDTTLQKIMYLLGPPRAGKGTIIRVLTNLINPVNVANPTLNSLSGNFGLQSLINATLAVINDARLDRHINVGAVVERLLNISGEDGIEIDRKFKPPWTGKLHTRFVIVSNEIPHLPDSSGALLSRLLIIKLTRSFRGHEDVRLFEKLMREMPGILNWALAGLYRLRERGHFLQPDSARETLELIDELASPINAFLQSDCVVDPAGQVLADDLYRCWADWCQGQNRRPGTKGGFGKDMHAAVPGLKVTQPREFERQRMYGGVRLRRPDDA